MDEFQPARVDSSRFLRRLARNRWRTILVGFLVVVLPTASWVFLWADPTYEASAVLFVVPSREDPALPAFLREFVAPETSALYLATMKSRSLAQAVAGALPRESRDELLKRVVFRDYVLALINAVRRLRGEEVIVYSPLEQMVRELQEARMSFSTAKDGTVVVTALAYSPRVAMDLANTYIDILLARSTSHARQQARATRELLEGMVAQARANQVEAEDALQKFRTQGGGGVRLPEDARVALTKLAHLEATLGDFQVNREIAEASLRFLRGAQERTSQAPPQAIDPATRALAQRLSQLEAKLAVLSEKYTDQHPTVRATRAELEDVQDRLKGLLQPLQEPKPEGGRVLSPAESAALAKHMATLGVAIMSYQAREASLGRRITELKNALTSMSALELEYSRRWSAVESQRNLVGLLSDKLAAARINEQAPMRGIQVVDQAALPRQPSTKLEMRALLLAVGAGLGIGVGLAMLRERAHEVIETEEDVARITGLPVLGSIPLVRRAGPRRGGNPVNFHENGGPSSLAAEACRTIRSGLESLGTERELRLLLVTSPGPGEGKTTVLFNLTAALVETSREFLLIDADLRHPSLHRLVAAPNERGLADLLQNDAAFPESCHPVAPGLRFVPAGVEPSNPGALLSSKRMAALLGQARQQADMTLLDSPPVLAVSDSLPLASLADGIVLVVRSGMTQRRRLVRAKGQLEKVRGRIVGVVINGLPPREARRHYVEYMHYVAVSNGGRKRRGR